MLKAIVKTLHSPRCPLARAQRGVSLLFALMALVALSLAAVALLRSVDGGTALMGNLGFKQDATAASDQAAEEAITWLSANLSGSVLEQDGADGSGYYATSLDAFDPTGSNTAATTRVVADWDDDGCANVAGAWTRCLEPRSLPAPINGNLSKYVITRLCATVGGVSSMGNSCAIPLTQASTGDKNKTGRTYTRPTGFGEASGGPYYRIVVRTAGARNTRSYTETIVHF